MEVIMDFKEVEKIIDKYIDEIIDFRRDIHSHPELSGNEKRTSEKVIEKLNKLPVEIITNVNGYGVIANLKGNTNKKTILLRGDMDALPINEINDLPFISKNKNIMHACGHDMHTSILLGTSFVLSYFKDKLNGNVKFMFQPSEEASPIGGSKGMIAEGLLENPRVDEAYALHVFGIPTGSVAIKPGVATSRSDRIDIEIFGKSSHASIPSEGRDAIVVAGNIITSIQSIISRNMPPNQTAVITIGKMEGGSRYNVLADYVKLEGTVRTFSTENADMIKERLQKIVEDIASAYGCSAKLNYQNGYDFVYNDPDLSADYVKLEGTVRTFSTENADMIKERLQKIVEDIASAYGCSAKLNYQNGYDFVYNDPDLSEAAIKSLNEILGRENVLVQSNPLPAGEDFSFVTKKVPSVFMWLGTESDFNKGKCTLHSPEFIADETSLKIGIKTLCKLVFDRLN